MISTEPIASEHKARVYDRKRDIIIDFDVQQTKGQMAVLHMNDAVYVYDFASSSMRFGRQSRLDGGAEERVA